MFESAEAQRYLWRELVCDFGHELITGVHVPLTWTDERPSDAEFRALFAAVRLRSHRFVDFVRSRRHVLTKLVLTNSEGYGAGGVGRGGAGGGGMLAVQAALSEAWVGAAAGGA